MSALADARIHIKGASLLCSIVWVLADLLDGYGVSRPFLFCVRLTRIDVERIQTTKMSKSISECDADADSAIRKMIAGMVGAAAIPAHVNWAVCAAAMGVGTVAIGKAYGVTLNKEQGGKLVKEFIKSAGFMFLALNVGSKIWAAIMESTGIGYLGGVALDGAISAAQAWAVGACAKEYFRRDFLGQNKPSTKELGEIFRKAFKDRKNGKK